MATLALGTVGAVAGSFIAPGIGTSIGWSLGSMAGSMIDSYLFRDEEHQEGPRLGDIQVQNASYGVPQPIPYGTVRLAGNLIWTDNITELTEEEEVGGKGGSGTTVSSYTYFGCFAVGLCEGPIAGVRKIWADQKLIYDVDAANEGPASKYGDVFRFYLGTDDQLPDPTMESVLGAGEVPAYRDLAYIMLGPGHNFPLADFGNRLPNITAEVYTLGATAYPAILQEDTFWAGAAILYDPVTHTTLGYAFDLTDSVYKISRVNTIDNTLLYTVDDTSPSGIQPTAALAVDPLRNRFYTCVDYATNHWPLGHFDLNTGAYLTTTLLPSLGVVYDITVAGNWIWVCSIFGYSGMLLGYEWRWSTDLSGNPVENLVLAVSLDITDSGDPHPWMSVVDRDGVCWAVGNSAFDDNTRIYRATQGGALTVYVPGITSERAFIGYDPTEHALLIGDMGGSIYKWDITTETLGANTPTNTAGVYTQQTFKRGPVGGSLWTMGGLYYLEVDIATMTVARSISIAVWTPTTGTPLGVVYDDTSHALWITAASADPNKLLLDRTEPEPPTLADIVTDISERAGLTAGQLNVSALTQEVHGYALTRRMPARQAIEPLQQAYFFEAVESDYTIKFPLRGGSVAATLTADDLAAMADSGEPPDPLTHTRAQDVDLPQQVDVLYIEPEQDYQQGTQSQQRHQETMASREPLTISLPIAMDKTTARQIAEKSLFLSWVDRDRYDLTLPPKYARLDPGDIAEVTYDGVLYRLRLTATDLGADGVIRCQSHAEQPAVYVSTISGATAQGVPTQTISIAGATTLYLMDIPLLRDGDDGAGFYAAMMGLSDWPGGVLYTSTDGALWESLYTENDPVAAGSALTALPSGPTATFDRANTLTVRLSRGELTSYTQAQVLNWANGALVGSELIQWTTATQVDATTWTLSGLLRGRKGTEWAVSTHTAGERFIVIGSTTVRRVPRDAALLDLERFYRAVTAGGSLSTTPSYTFTNTGMGLLPYSPVHLAGTRDGSNNLTLTWIRRTRIDGEWRDSVDVSLGEDSESYTVTILSGPGGSVVRTISGLTSQTTTYSAANQTTDGFTPGNPITFRVSQVSATVGAGTPTEATV
jgi:Putative phage tail protein